MEKLKLVLLMRKNKEYLFKLGKENIYQVFKFATRKLKVS